MTTQTETISTTPISEQLADAAARWFEQHPGTTSLLRRYVPGELPLAQEQDAHFTHVYVKHVFGPVSARVPMPQHVYDDIRRQYPISLVEFDLNKDVK